MNATRTILTDVLWRWQRAIGRASLLLGVLAGMTLGAPAQAQIAFRAASQANSAAGQPAPNFQAAGTAAGGAGVVNPAWPAHQIDDIALLFVESTGGQAATLSIPAGFVEVTNSPQATGAGTAGTRITVFWARATSAAMATPRVADPGNHVYAQILTYRGVIAAGDPWDVSGGGVKAAASTTVTVTGVTTTVPNTLIVQAVARDNDNAAAAFSAQTNANLTGITERSDAGTTQGNGGGFAVWDGDMAAAGATGDTTATVTSSINAFLTVALRPPDSVLTINVPAGTLANDVMIASITYRPCSNASGAACTTTITPPAGWTQVNSVTDQTAGGGTGGFGNRLFVYQRVATGAEPADYTWTFGGQVVHAGAAGGILSFSGVDTTTPVVAEAGSLTASATSHTAPSVPLGGVTGAMLVTSHSANSSATWTAPAGMTSTVNAASLGVPNDLGLSLQVNTLPNAPDPTVARTASWTSPPAADTGDTHTLALRPAVVVVPTPGSFNAYETGTVAGAITGVIKTKIAGSTISLDIIALNSAKTAILTTFTGTVRVEVLDASNNSGVLDVNGCRPTWTVIQTLSPDPAFIAGDNGRKTISFTQANSYPNARLRITFPAGAPTVTGCSTDNFAIRPDSLASFAVSDTDWQTAGTGRALNLLTFAAITPTHKAGRPFSVRATAVNAAGTPATTTNYVGVPTATLTACAGAACTATFGTLTLGTTFAAGLLASDVASYDDVGSFRLELVDSSFAGVDAGDSSALEREIRSGTIDVGRFVPDHFAVSLNTPVFLPGCGPFTYIGQTFNYTTAPVITVTAQDFANNTTTLYNTIGSWFRITNASLTGKAYTAAIGGPPDVSGLPGIDPVIVSTGAGVGTLTFDSGTGLFFTRTTPTAPASPYDADIRLAINVIDADGVILTTNPASFGTATAGNGIAFSDGNALTTSDKQMRFGRLRLSNALGSELLGLPVPIETQYWNGTAFVTNIADDCTNLNLANITLGNYQRNGADTWTTGVSFTGPFSAGVGNLTLSKPILVITGKGSVDVTVDLAAESKTYLQGAWTGATYTQNPTARAAFGVYKGSNEFIYLREMY